MKKLGVILWLILLFSCQLAEKEVVFQGFEPTDSLMLYQPTVAKIANDKLLMMASMAAEKHTGKVKVKLLIKNKDYNPVIQFNPFEMQLSNAQGIRTQLMHFAEGDSVKVLTKDKTAEYEFMFYPINSLKLYRLTQLRGDLSQQYYLSTDFVQTLNGEALGLPPLQFQVPDTVYQAYLAQYGQEKNLRVYQLRDDTAVLKEKILQHLHKKLPLVDKSAKSHSVSINEQEFLIDGAVIKFLVYSLSSTIYWQISIVNHSDYPFSVDVERIFLEHASQKILPVNLADERLLGLRRTPDNKKIALLKGERFQFTFLFKGLQQDAYTGFLEGIEIGERPISVFPSGITIKVGSI